MTQKEITDGNKLIAEFMGGIKSKIDGPGKWIRFPNIHAGTDSYAFHPKKLKYDSSWDWLMPVIQKIGKLYDNGETNLSKLIYHSVFANIENVFASVIEFIHEYNSLYKK